MKDAVLDMAWRAFREHVLPEIIDALQVNTISIVGGLMAICFVAQMLTGKAKWGRRAWWVAGVGLVAVVLVAAL